MDTLHTNTLRPSTIVSCTYICAFIGGIVFLSLPLLFLLLQLLDALLKYIGPEVTFKVWKLLGTSQTVLCCLLEDVLSDKGGEEDNCTCANNIVVAYLVSLVAYTLNLELLSSDVTIKATANRFLKSSACPRNLHRQTLALQ